MAERRMAEIMPVGHRLYHNMINTSKITNEL